jgi:hypothetical protein
MEDHINEPERVSDLYTKYTKCRKNSKSLGAGRYAEKYSFL